MILVSACLLGEKTRYDGRHSLCPSLLQELGDEPCLAVCPEVLGGLPIPRPPARFAGADFGQEGGQVLAGAARLLNNQGNDVSAAFVSGARKALAMARQAGVTRCYLKDRSPSCGHDPLGVNPRGGPGQGVLTALLLAAGLSVVEVRAAGAGTPK